MIFIVLLSERLSFADERENHSVASGLNYNSLLFQKCRKLLITDAISRFINLMRGGGNKQRRMFPFLPSVPNLFNNLIPTPSRSSKKGKNSERMNFTNEDWEEDVINVVKVHVISLKLNE